jgi:hypothetical protein
MALKLNELVLIREVVENIPFSESKLNNLIIKHVQSIN